MGLLDLAEMPPTMIDDIAVGFDRHDARTCHLGSEVALVLVMSAALPVVDVAARPNPALDRQEKPRLFLQFPLRGSLE